VFLIGFLGDSVSIDIATIFHGAQFVKYNLSFLGYGFYGDCVLDSEANRWMGPKRYDWEGTMFSVFIFYECCALFPLFSAECHLCIVFVLIGTNISVAYN